MTSPLRRRGLVPAAAFAVVGAGIVADRYLLRRVRRRVAEEPFGSLEADRAYRVGASDGIQLSVEEVGPTDAPLTIVFVHGFMLELASWHYQRLALAADDVRLVLYDQRCHGGSDSCDDSALSVSQLGRDLLSVIDTAAPRGPVVLVGHSMGGIAVQALVEDFPEVLRERVVAVALISSSAGQLEEVTFGLPRAVVRPLRRTLPPLVQQVPAALELARRAGGGARVVLTQLYSFGSRVDPALVAFMDAMLSRVPFTVVTSFWPMFLTHHKADSLPRLAGLPTVVVVGDADRIIPPGHSELLAALVPGSELTVVPGAGHMVILERPDVVNDVLLGLVNRLRDRPS
ncbi:MAG: alpha/beta hydrolase fold protein [Frankiales bacterium]|nr:alpha/beta hydrolase fold protein [Frankiales bacterium]